MSNNLQAYALFVNEEFRTTMYYPSEGSEQALRTTAALQSSPSISLDTSNKIDSVNIYLISVDDEYVDSLIISKENPAFDLSTLHNALSSDPLVVWIESDILPNPLTKWSYENGILSVVED
jgi:hypothetical protein